MNNNFIISFLILTLFLLSSCVTVKNIKDGDTAFERKRYAQAISLLKGEYEKATVENIKAHKAYYLGESNRRLGELNKALKWYKKAVELNYGSQAVAQYAFTLKQVGKFAKAKELLEYLSNEFPQNQKFQEELTSIGIIKGWNENEKYRGVKLQNLDLNTEYSEYYPRRLSSDEILFLSDRVGSTGEDTYHWTGRAYSDIYVYDHNRNSVRKYEKNINTKYNEGMLAIDSSGNTVIYTQCGKDSDDYEDDYCQLFFIENPNSFYREAVKMPFVREEYNYFHPCLNARGDLLIFSAFLPDGRGRYDLWYSRKIDGIWQEPKLMSSRLNTRGDEMYPSMDGDTLYFSSDYITGYGGFDIFKTYIRKDGSWAPPQNLKSPINSGYDEIGFIPDHAYANENNLDFAGYFSSNREEGRGSDDIYFFKQQRITKTKKEKDDEKEIFSQLRLNIKVKKKRFNVKNNPNSGIDTLIDHRSSTIKVKNELEYDSTLNVNKVGEVLIPLDTPFTYSFTVSAENYLTTTFELNTRNRLLPDREVTTLSKTVVLDSIIRNVEIVLKDIYYDFDRWEIRKDAEPTLDTLSQLLKDNPGLNIQLNSHTDCRGDETYNKELSQKRAQSAVDYLVENGINRERLTAKGYGEAKPKNNCDCAQCTDKEHQQNRRTSFTIIE